MRSFLLLLAAAASLLEAQTGIPAKEYQERRQKLQKSLDGALILFGANESDDIHLAFFQDSNFLYLTGWREPGAAMMITPTEEILFLPPRNERAEIFTGKKLVAEDANAKEKTGFAKVLPRSAIESNFQRIAESNEKLYVISNDPQVQKLRSLAVLHDYANAATPIGRLRVVKSTAEVELITKATDASVLAHKAAWKAIKPGQFEYQVATEMTNVYFEQGCERHAYPPIVGSGPNSVILHYMSNKRRMDSGEVVVMDVGAECSDYATDITRTIPTNGKFTPRQREIYEIVLGAQKAAIAAMKPGVRMSGDATSLTQIVRDYFNSHGKDLHGAPLGKYFTHGLGHQVGLDVHDPEAAQTIQAGMVVTIEPGLYIPEENIGVRIEDTVLMTENGPKVLSAGLPKEVDEIEKLVGK